VFAYFRAPLSWPELAKRTVIEAVNDGCPGLAAQLGFYFLLAVFPAILFLVSLLAYLPVEPGLGSALGRLQAVLPEEVFALVRRQIDAVLAGRRGGLMTLAVAGAVWSSSSAMTAIIHALNRAYDIEEWRAWWHTRLVATALTLGLALFGVAATLSVVGGTELAAWAATHLGLGDLFVSIWSVAQWPVAFALAIVSVNLVYHFAPNAETEWVWITPGAILAVVLWLLTSFGFRIYIQALPSYTAVYGAMGGVIVLLLWLYLSGFALLIGAELNAEIDRALPSRDDRPQGPGQKKRIGPAAERAYASRAPQRVTAGGAAGQP